MPTIPYSSLVRFAPWGSFASGYAGRVSGMEVVSQFACEVTVPAWKFRADGPASGIVSA